MSFGLRFVCQVNEAQLEAHRLLSSTAGARSGAARASRSRAARAARASAAGRFKQMAWSVYLAADVLYRLKSCVLVHIQRCVDLVWLLQPRAHQCAGASLILASIIVRISWLTGRGQQSDSYIAGSNHAMTLARMHVASLLLGRCPQTRALLAFSRRDVSADLTWRAHRRIAE